MGLWLKLSRLCGIVGLLIVLPFCLGMIIDLLCRCFKGDNQITYFIVGIVLIALAYAVYVRWRDIHEDHKPDDLF